MPVPSAVGISTDSGVPGSQAGSSGPRSARTIVFGAASGASHLRIEPGFEGEDAVE